MSRTNKVPSAVADLRALTDRGIIKRPIVNEKSVANAAQNKYTFEVALTANKIQIRNAVHRVFGVDVTKVTTLRRMGNTRRKMRKDEGTTPETKRAVVTLKTGQTIEFDGRPLFEA
jgi:large subunit ribosomal protein L23